MYESDFIYIDLEEALRENSLLSKMFRSYDEEDEEYEEEDAE